MRADFPIRLELLHEGAGDKGMKYMSKNELRQWLPAPAQKKAKVARDEPGSKIIDEERALDLAFNILIYNLRTRGFDFMVDSLDRWCETQAVETNIQSQFLRDFAIRIIFPAVWSRYSHIGQEIKVEITEDSSRNDKVIAMALLASTLPDTFIGRNDDNLIRDQITEFEKAQVGFMDHIRSLYINYLIPMKIRRVNRRTT